MPQRHIAAVLAALALCLCALGGLAAGAQARTPSSGDELGPGNSGKAVRLVQRRLHIRVTGYYDGNTAKAVRRFQKKHHLPADGIVGADTAKALHVDLKAASYYPTGGASPDSGKRVKLPPVLVKIARCESGGNPRALSRTGRYRGKYQFDLETWHSIGGKGDPAKASEYEQDRRALKLYRKRGTAPWPNCA